LTDRLVHSRETGKQLEWSFWHRLFCPSHNFTVFMGRVAPSIGSWL